MNHLNPTAKPRGLTLIEMLIVIAIIAIGSASTIMLVTSPLAEAARASHAQARQALLAQASLQIQRDASLADVLENSLQNNEFVLKTFPPFPRTVRYRIQDGKLLRQENQDEPRIFPLPIPLHHMVVQHHSEPHRWLLQLHTEEQPILPRIAPAELPPSSMTPITLRLRTALFAPINPETAP